MDIRSSEDVMLSLGEERLLMFDNVLRTGVAAYFKIALALRVEHDSRAQAAVTYSHIVAEAERQFDNLPGVRFMEIQQLKLWLFEDPDVVVSFKKMNKYGHVKRHDSKQQRDFDAQLPLEGLPIPPTRLRVGYLLDDFATNYVRTQIATPNNKSNFWCVAIHPQEDRVAGQSIWYDITQQKKLGIG